MVEVVAAIIEREGRVLIGQRKPEQSHPLKWEFPGGKVEPGETPRDAVARELAEELAIQVADAAEIQRYEYTYPGKKPIQLFFFHVRSFTGEPRNLIFHDLRWQPAADLASMDFLEGDIPFLRHWTGFMPH
jgi:8-oxo-dGTP diphosphatase